MVDGSQWKSVEGSMEVRGSRWKSIWKLVEVGGSRGKNAKINVSTRGSSREARGSRCKSVEVDVEEDGSRWKSMEVGRSLYGSSRKSILLLCTNDFFLDICTLFSGARGSFLLLSPAELPGARLYTTVQVWVPGGLRGASSGRPKSRNLARYSRRCFPRS